MWRRRFDQKCGGRTDFTAERESLNEPEHQQGTGAAGPIIAYDGVSTMPRMPTPISVKLSSIAGFLRRDRRSADHDCTDRTADEADANVSNDNIRFSNGVCVGKNVRPICTANSAWVVKS